MDRLKDWFVSCVRAAIASLPFAGTYRYSVVSCDFAAQTLDLAALDNGQPDLTKVAMRVPGLRLEIASGTEVGVSYFGLDPQRPYVAVFGQDPASVTRIEIVGATSPVVRRSDMSTLFSSWIVAPSDGGAALKTTWLSQESSFGSAEVSA